MGYLGKASIIFGYPCDVRGSNVNSSGDSEVPNNPGLLRAGGLSKRKLVPHLDEMPQVKVFKPTTIQMVADKWNYCVSCTIGVIAKRKVFFDGDAQAKFMFVGEGPGVSEDALGLPFIGPSGRLLRKALNLAGYRKQEWCLTNLVACRPCDDRKGPNRAPTQYEVSNCKERLQDTVDVVSPRAIVAVGTVPNQYIRQRYRDTFHIRHPAFVLRRGGDSSEEFKQLVHKLKQIRRRVVWRRG